MSIFDLIKNELLIKPYDEIPSRSSVATTMDETSIVEAILSDPIDMQPETVSGPETVPVPESASELEAIPETVSELKTVTVPVPESETISEAEAAAEPEDTPAGSESVPEPLAEAFGKPIWVCTKCGTENSGKLCIKCSEPRSAENQYWICNVCAFGNDGRFCTQCGNKKPDIRVFFSVEDPEDLLQL